VQLPVVHHVIDVALAVLNVIDEGLGRVNLVLLLHEHALRSFHRASHGLSPLVLLLGLDLLRVDFVDGLLHRLLLLLHVADEADVQVEFEILLVLDLLQPLDLLIAKDQFLAESLPREVLVLPLPLSMLVLEVPEEAVLQQEFLVFLLLARNLVYFLSSLASSNL